MCKILLKSIQPLPLYACMNKRIWAWVFGRPFVKRFALCYQTVVSPDLSVCPVLSVCDVGVLWPNGWMDQDETWHGGRPRTRPHCVKWGPSSPSPKGHSPQFFAHVCCGQTAGWMKMPLSRKVSLNRSDTVLDGDPAPPPKKGQNPEILGPCLLRPKGYMH